MTFRTVDKRFIEPAAALSQIPAVDASDAQYWDVRPPARVRAAMEPYVPPEEAKEEPAFDMAPLKGPWNEFLKTHSMKAEAEAFMKPFKELLPACVGDATLLVMGRYRDPVATLRFTGPLNMTRLRAEQPEVIARFTRRRWVETFDKEAFLQEEPVLATAYRGRRLLPVK